MNGRDAIRRHYASVMPMLMRQRDEWGVDPYAWESCGCIKLTPIERALWAEIRSVDAVLYPQFPIGPYFVDFGNPAARVAIECDGKEWHLDLEADAARQSAIERRGWTVYRITGSDCMRHSRESLDEAGHLVVHRGVAAEFMREIAEKHGIARGKRAGESRTLGDGLTELLDSILETLQ